MMIAFEFDGKMYEVDWVAAYAMNLIALPDGRVLWVDVWSESEPSRPTGFYCFRTNKAAFNWIISEEDIVLIPDAVEISNEINRYP